MIAFAAGTATFWPAVDFPSVRRRAGATGRQDIRAIIYNSANIGAAMLVAVAIAPAGIDGAFASSYAVEALTAVVAWVVLLRFVEADRARDLSPATAH